MWDLFYSYVATACLQKHPWIAVLLPNWQSDGGRLAENILTRFISYRHIQFGDKKKKGGCFGISRSLIGKIFSE